MRGSCGLIAKRPRPRQKCAQRPQRLKRWACKKPRRRKPRWCSAMTQHGCAASSPQGATFRYLELIHEWYSALRRAGLDVDVVSPDADLTGYTIVLIPTLPIVPHGFLDRLAASNAHVLFGPRSGSKTQSFTIPEGLAPGDLRALLPLTVSRVESLRDGVSIGGDGWTASRWREEIETELEPRDRGRAGMRRSLPSRARSLLRGVAGSQPA